MLGYQGEPFRWKPQERYQLRARLDALFTLTLTGYRRTRLSTRSTSTRALAAGDASAVIPNRSVRAGDSKARPREPSLGTVPIQEQTVETQLTVRIVGPGVPPGKIALKDLQRIVHPLEQAVQELLRATEHPTGDAGRAKRPKARFLLSGLGQGSAIADLELDMEIDPEQNLLGLDSDPIRDLITGIQDSEHSKYLLPPSASQQIKRMAERLPPGVDLIELSLAGAEERAQIQRRDPTAPLEISERRTISGRLIAVDFGAGRARLQLQAGKQQRKKLKVAQLRFADELATDMQQCIRQLVVAQGEATVSAAGGIQSLAVERIWAEHDDRRGLWPAKRFRWPAPEELLDNVDVEDFLENIHGVDEDDE